MNRAAERWYPWAAGLSAAALWWALAPKFPLDEKELLAAALSLSAVLTGFITTAKAILAALPSDSVMGRLRQSGYIDDLIEYLAHALYGCLSFSVLCVAGFFLLPSLPKWFATVWMGLGVFSLLAFFRVSRLLFRVIRSNPSGD